MVSPDSTRSAPSAPQTGVLTPEEFVRAGDQLIASCATWQW